MTIAQQLKITEFPFIIKDSKGNTTYYEDANGNEIYWENSDAYWEKWEYDASSNQRYYENSDGDIRDKRPKTEVQKAIDLLTKEGLLVDGKVLK